MWRLQPEFRFTKEFDGATEYWASLLLEKPITPLFSLYAQILREEAWGDDNGTTNRADWDRFGLGFRWIVMPELIWWQGLNFDYTNGDDFGLDTRLMWWPTDPLRITAGFNSFSLSVPIRARVQGITADSAYLDVLYLESDLREYGAAVGTQWFSDNNVYIAGTARYDQNVYLTPDLKVRGGFALGFGTYSKQDVDYYSPQYEWSALLDLRHPVGQLHPLREEVDVGRLPARRRERRIRLQHLSRGGDHLRAELRPLEDLQRHGKRFLRSESIRWGLHECRWRISYTQLVFLKGSRSRVQGSGESWNVLAILFLMVSSAHAAESFITLCYHDIPESPVEKDDISQKDFVNQIEYLRTHGFTFVSPADILAASRGAKTLPEKAVLLTFDDAYESFYRFVYPALRLYNIPAVLSVVTSWIDNPETSGYKTKRFMGWPQIREVSDSGLVTVASHSARLHRLLQANPVGNVEPAPASFLYFPESRRYETEPEFRARIGGDLASSIDVLTAKLGRKPAILTWPYGSYNAIGVEEAKKLGFEMILTLDDGYSQHRQPRPGQPLLPGIPPRLACGLQGLAESAVCRRITASGACRSISTRSSTRAPPKRATRTWGFCWTASSGWV